MIDQGLFRKYFVGRDGFHWWIGQIAEESSWVDNKNGTPSKSNKDTPGFGERYKVRIMGYHTAVPSELPDDHLPWATVMYPVTAGGAGDAGTSETANLRQGNFVFGFFMDGEDGQQPVIMGVIGYNNYTAIMAEVPDAKFVPFTGLNASRGQNSPTFVRKSEPDPGDVAPVPSTAPLPTTAGQTPPPNNTQTGGTINDKVNVGTESASESQSAADTDSAEEKQSSNVVPKPSKCDPIPLAGTATNISNFIKDIEKTRKTVTDYRYAATRGVVDLQAEIEFKKEQTSNLIMGTIKSALNEGAIFAEKTMNDIIKGINALLQPNESYAASVQFNGLVEYIICMIKKVFSAISTYISQALDNIIDKVINAAKCFVNNFVSAVLGTVNGLISQLLNYFTGVLTNFIDSTFGIATGALSAVQAGFDIILDVISFLTCSSDEECQAYYVEEWNILTGGNQNSFPVNDLINGVKTVSNNVKNVTYNFQNLGSGFGNIISTFGNTLQSQLNNVFDISTCNIGPIFCGPPSISIFGGTGAGFAANPVLDANGSIIAVDIISMGRGYSQGGSVTAKVVDACGNGNGGVLFPVLGISLNDILGFGNGSNRDGVYASGLFEDGQRGVIDSYWQDRRSELFDGAEDDGTSLVTQIDGTGFSGLIRSNRLTPTLVTPVGATTNVSVGQTTLILDSEILDNLKTDSFSGLIPSGRFQGLGPLLQGEGSQVSLSTSFVGASGDPVNIGIAAGVQANNIDYTQLTSNTGSDNNIDRLISETPEPSTDTITTGINTEVTDGTLGVSGMIILDGGSGYLRRPNGSQGGMNRIWAEANQTTVKKKDGTYLLPSNPGKILTLAEGDTVNIPVGTKVVSEPLDDGEGGGETILGGKAHKVTKPGKITTPEKEETSDDELGDYPSSTDGTYPVITHLASMYVEDSGVGYSNSDEVVITPSEGAEATITVTELGAIKTIKVTKKGEGFKVKPTAYIKSKGGIGAIINPQLGIDTVDEEKLKEPGVKDKVIQVKDVAGAYQ